VSSPIETEDKRPTIGPETVLKILVDFNLHQDRLIWSQLQTMIALQGATLAGGYALRGTSLSVIVVLLGVAFLAFLYLYIERLRKNRDINMPVVDKLINRFGENTLKEILGEVNGRWLKFSSPLPEDRRFYWDGSRLSVRGHTLLQGAFVLFAVADIVAVALFPCLPRI
jgi:hypothetical protein